MSLNKKNKRIPFSQRLFWSIFSIFMGFIFCFLVFQYQREQQFSQEKLNTLLSNYNKQLAIRCTSDALLKEQAEAFLREIPQKDLRITIIAENGEVLYDNISNDILDNHNDRSEVHKALNNDEGYAIRNSGSTGQRYFYSASRIGNYVFRTALPYTNQLKQFLSVNIDFVYFMLFMLLAFFFVLSRFTFSIGKSISKLRDFAQKVEQGSLPEIDEEFPNDELGDISHNIITLYTTQQKIKEEEGRMKRQLTQNVAHELKTPVSSIQGYLETILHTPGLTEEKRNYFLERCYSQSSRLSDLLTDISVLNRLDEASALFDFAEVDIAELIASIEKECTQKMEEKKITSTVTLNVNPIIKGNNSLLYSIFRNLYDNAIAYAGEGSKITISCDKEENGYYHFTFSDNGIGIGEEHLARIFERFYRIDKGRSRKLGGTGLGLSIVKNAVLFHKGTISAKSKQGEGVTFLFTLNKDLKAI